MIVLLCHCEESFLRKDDEAISAYSLGRRGAMGLLRFARNDIIMSLGIKRLARFFASLRMTL
jgi:hypothetical protein